MGRGRDACCGWEGECRRGDGGTGGLAAEHFNMQPSCGATEPVGAAPPTAANCGCSPRWAATNDDDCGWRTGSLFAGG